jgi:hypothetical protein
MMQNAEIYRRVVAMLAADRRQIARWGAAVRGTGTVTRWQSAMLLERSVAARAWSGILCARSAVLQQEALALRGRPPPPR